MFYIAAINGRTPQAYDVVVYPTTFTEEQKTEAEAKTEQLNVAEGHDRELFVDPWVLYETDDTTPPLKDLALRIQSAFEETLKEDHHEAVHPDGSVGDGS